MSPSRRGGEPGNPVRTLWQAVTLCLSIVGFSSLMQDGLKHLFAWKGFVYAVVESYRSVRNTMVDLLLGWLPFETPSVVIDYFVIGLIVAVAANRVFREAFEEEFGRLNWPEGLPKPRQGLIAHKSVLYVLWAWPFAFFSCARAAFYAYKTYRLGFASWTKVARGFGPEALTFMWVAAILFGFILLLSINAFLPEAIQSASA